jgi:formylglycine-generating enzyme
MIKIRGREFAMGDNGSTFSKPKHRISVDTFFIDKYEVTNRQYQKFVIDRGYQPPESWSGTDYPTGLTFYPVTGVTWYDAVVYCEWAGKRLPSEAEWELACKGPDDRLYPWGQESGSRYANTAELSCGTPTTVGSFLPIIDGQLADLSGNVNEWTYSIFRPYPYSASDGRESSNGNNEKRVIRGGSYELKLLTCANRLNALPQMTIADTGFRCARSKQ